MQYNININQKQLYELSQELGVEISIKTASVLDYFKSAHTVFKVKVINNEIYYKTEYQKVLNQNPLLNIGIKQLTRHFDKLVEMKILKKEIVKGGGTDTYFATDENYIKCFFEITQDKNVLLTRQKCSVRQDKNVLSYNIDHNTNKYINNKHIKKIYKKENENEKTEPKTPNQKTPEQMFDENRQNQNLENPSPKFSRLKEIISKLDPRYEQSFHQKVIPYFNELLESQTLNQDELEMFCGFILERKTERLDFRAWCIHRNTYLNYFTEFTPLLEIERARIERLTREGREFQERLAREKAEANKTPEQIKAEENELLERKAVGKDFIEMCKKAEIDRKREKAKKEQEIQNEKDEKVRIANEKYQKEQLEMINFANKNKEKAEKMAEYIKEKSQNQPVEKLAEVCKEAMRIFNPEQYKELYLNEDLNSKTPTFTLNKIQDVEISELKKWEAEKTDKVFENPQMQNYLNQKYLTKIS